MNPSGLRQRSARHTGAEGDLFGPVFAPVRNGALFAQVHLDEFGGPCWRGGADLVPDGLYARLTGYAVTH